jgi:hypothetical protein
MGKVGELGEDALHLGLDGFVHHTDFLNQLPREKVLHQELGLLFLAHIGPVRGLDGLPVQGFQVF